MAKNIEKSLRRNDFVSKILERAPLLNLPNWYLGAGCIAQTVWNELHGFTPIANIKDYDLVYFDSSDLSYEAEEALLQKGNELFRDLGILIEIKNEARVHLWYQNRFGYRTDPYNSIEDAISSWPTTATSIGVKIDEKGGFHLYAPYGLDDLFAMVLRPNKRQITKEIYMAKVRRWTELWPKLTVVPWD